MKFKLFNTVIASLIISFSSLATAGLIVNGGFETGNFSGWVDHNGGGSSCSADWYVETSDTQCQHTNTALGLAGEGNFSAWNAFDSNSANAVYEISQTLTLGNFDTAILNFDYTVGWNFGLGGTASLDRVFSLYFKDQNNGLIGNAFSLSIGLSDGDTGIIGWNSNAIDISTLLSSYSNQDVTIFARTYIPQSFTGPGSFGLDAIDVTTTVDVPEPSTLAIFALGMICLASRRFKKHA